MQAEITVEVMRLFRDFHLAPTQIDKKLSLPSGTARQIIVDEWWHHKMRGLYG